MSQSIHLQSVGQHIAKLAGEIQVGDVLVWNFGSLSRVESVKAVSAHFVEIVAAWTKSDGSVGRSTDPGFKPRRLKKDRLVGFSPKATAEGWRP